MALLDDMKALADSLGATLTEKKGAYRMRSTVAERKAFLSHKKLEYIASFKIDDAARKMGFTELLKESGSGLSDTDDFDDSGMTTGFGFKTETYRTGGGPREGNINEQSNYFGKRYDYTFDFREVRSKAEALAQAAGYEFYYALTAGSL